MITKKDLKDWIEEYQENILFDGPISLSSFQEEMFLEKCNANSELLTLLEEEEIIEEGDELFDISVLTMNPESESTDIILDILVEFLKEIQITEL